MSYWGKPILAVRKTPSQEVQRSRISSGQALHKTEARKMLEILACVPLSYGLKLSSGDETMSKASSCLFVVLVAGLCTYFLPALSGDEKGGASKERFFEMRTYTAAPGKLDDLHARFRNHTNKLFQKHGMTLIGYWTPAEGEGSKNTLVYILA